MVFGEAGREVRLHDVGDHPVVFDLHGVEAEPSQVVPLGRRRILPNGREVAKQRRRLGQHVGGVAFHLERRELGLELIALGEVVLSRLVAPPEQLRNSLQARLDLAPTVLGVVALTPGLLV